MRIPFVGPAYTARSSDISAQRCINWYVESTENQGAKVPAALIPTPGLILKATVGGGPIRGAVSVGSTLYLVSGTGVYRLDTLYSATLLGSIGGSGLVGMASNGAQVLIVDGISGYIITVATNVLATITDVDFPNGVTNADYADGYFIVSGEANSQTFEISAALAGTNWDGTDFASAEASPDIIVGQIVDHREAWFFGTNSTEVWWNSGNADFPFERISGGFLEHGCAARRSIAKMDNTVYWLGADDRGDGTVWKAAGYSPQRISTHAIELAINQEGNLSAATAWTYQQEGHNFYVLTVGDRTFCYDASTNLWHERAYFSNGEFFAHRAHIHVLFNGVHIVGDRENGKIYQLDLDTYTDAGDTIKRLRSAGPTDGDLNRIFYHEFEVDIEAGVGLATGQGSAPVMMLRYSDDGGHTWSNIRTSTMGAIGTYDARARWMRCGMGRKRVWEISVTDPVKAVVLGARVRTSEGIL